jgi:hypothetical protein
MADFIQAINSRNLGMPIHKTVEVGGIHIDIGILPLVAAINQLAGVRTVSSCQSWPLANNNAWVRFQVFPPEPNGDWDLYTVKVLRHIKSAISDAGVGGCQLTIEVVELPILSLCTIQCDPEDVDKVANVVERLEWPKVIG